MDTILTCAACQHKEQGSSRDTLMLKVRMWNHVHHDHPELIERFKEVVFTEKVPPAGQEYKTSERA